MHHIDLGKVSFRILDPENYSKSLQDQKVAAQDKQQYIQRLFLWFCLTNTTLFLWFCLINATLFLWFCLINTTLFLWFCLMVQLYSYGFV